MIDTSIPTAKNTRDIFDRKRRRLALARGARLTSINPGSDYLADKMAHEICARLDWVRRDFSKALLIGKAPDELVTILTERGIDCIMASPVATGNHGRHICCEEDFLPFANACFDLVIATATLDSVNDLPGALVLIRKILRPDGLFLAGFMGAGSWPRLKSAMMAADIAREKGTGAHVHPQIDVRAAGDLLQRAGFALPVADGETLHVRYAGLPSLVRDLRAMGGSNVMTAPGPFVGKAGLIAAAQHFATGAEDDGKTTETVEIVYLSGWSPSPDQPKPARRGSATASLAETLRTPAARPADKDRKP